MTAEDDEEKPLRSVALQNAASILAARQRTEREMVESKEALERKTEELAQANRRLVLLNQVANTLILGDAPQDQLKAAFEAVAREVGAQYFFNYAVDTKEPGTLVLAASGGLDPTRERDFGRIGFGQLLSGQVAASGRPLIVENVHLRDDEPTKAARALGIKAYAGFPLLAHGRLFGTLAFGSTGNARFAESDVDLLRALADQFAATLDRGRLLSNLRESETRYRAALTAGRMGSWETDFAAGTRTWSEEGMALFGLRLPHGRGQIGGDRDEFKAALHPEDRHLVEHFHRLVQEVESFAAEYRVVRPDGTTLWLSGRGRVAARSADGKALRLVNIVTDITDRRKAEEHIQLLMREISHRSKNLLAVIQAIAGQTARSAGTIEEFEMRFARRLHGLAASHDLLMHEGWRGAPIGELVRQQLAPFAEAGTSRLQLLGPEVVVTTEAAQAIGLALHELATNAIKYGALSMPAGKVTVSWEFEVDGIEPGRLRLSWLERGGPPVTMPSRKGFGHIVIERMVADALDGEIAMHFPPQGLSWTLCIPAKNLVPGTREEDTAQPQDTQPSAPN